jgi:NAD(P)H-dependent flavin oxidoreductase YrpB (nitropropane dioxygenase family)
MPIDTTLTTRLGITHPILSAPMATIAGAPLFVAVSEAGGHGASRTMTSRRQVRSSSGSRRWPSRSLRDVAIPGLCHRPRPCAD